MSKLSEDEIKAMNAGYCCDCGHRGWVPGSQNGVTYDIECGNLGCRARFSVAWWGNRFQAGTRIAKRSEGGFAWINEPEIVTDHPPPIQGR